MDEQQDNARRLLKAAKAGEFKDLAALRARGKELKATGSVVGWVADACTADGLYRDQQTEPAA